VLKEGLYEDFERRDTLLALARFKTTAVSGAWRSLKDYAAGLKENQTAIYYLVGDDIERLEASPHLEGFRARGVEVLLLADPIDSFWVTSGVSFDGKPFKSVTQGAADLALIPRIDATPETPMAPTILPPATIGTPPSATHAPNVNTRRPTPPPATASSSALVGRRNSTAVRALASASRTEDNCALSRRCNISRLPPESTIAIDTPHLFVVASASAAAMTFFAAAIDSGSP